MERNKQKKEQRKLRLGLKKLNDQLKQINQGIDEILAIYNLSDDATKQELDAGLASLRANKSRNRKWYQNNK